MFEKLEIARMAQALAAHAGARQAAVAQNVAQADTPGYRAVDLPDFAAAYRDAGDASRWRATRPGHIPQAAGGLDTQPRAVRGAASPDGNTVSLEAEMVKAAAVRQDHDMALSIYRSVSDILRASLGRPR